MLSLAVGFAVVSQSCYSAMIICAVVSHWFGKTKLAVTTRILCWIVGIINLPSIFVGGLGLPILAACYACYRLSGRVRFKYRIPRSQVLPGYDHILDAELD